MPGHRYHVAQAERNEQLYVALEGFSPRFRDWQITALFYAALHYVDAYLDAAVPPGNVHPQSHDERQNYARLFLAPVYQGYRDLERESPEARYATRVRVAPAALSASPFTRIRIFVRTVLSLPL